MVISQINACVIIPTYNNERTLLSVVEGVLKYVEPKELIIVNDGSTETTLRILEGLHPEITILHNEVNIGKGYSLRKGFAAAIEKGFANAITIDSDGQHFPDDIPKMIAAAAENEGALLMGSRNMEQEGVPAKSSFGNKFSNFWYFVETGIKLPDTQTGFRLYPLEPIKGLTLFTKKFETEIEVIVKLAWKDVPVMPVQINVLYDMNERVSHFRPFKDFTRISILNTYLVTLTLLWYLPKRLILNIRKRGILTLIREAALNTEESAFKKALAIGFGLFMGIFPIWGFQMLVGVSIAIYFRINKVLFLAAAQISLPPMIPFIIYLSYELGGLFVSNKVSFNTIHELTLETIHVNIIQYLIGAVFLSLICGFIGFIISYPLFSKRRLK